MAVQKIDYEDKIGLQNDENVPNKNKVTDDDMNEIKNKVNNNADELNTAQQNIENLQEGQSTASGDVTDLKSRVNTLEEDNTKNKQDIANKVDKVEGKGLSTEDYTTAEKQKLAGLKNYDDTEIKQDIQKIDKDISNIKTEQTEQNKRIEQTNNSLINITTEKSDNIHVEDSSNNVAKINVSGVSKQETREGYNLLNVASSYEITGSKTVPISMPAGNYTIKADDITTDSEQTRFCFSFRDSSGTIADARISLATKKTTFALAREATSVIIYSGNSFSESQGITTTYKNLMIYEGTDDKEYEEYGETPSPEISSEIENVTEDIDITVCNKNLCYEVKLGNTDNIEFYFNPKAISKQFSISFICNVNLNNNSLYYVVNKVQKTRIAQITSNANTKTIQEITLTDEVYNEIKNSSEAYFLLYKNNAGFTVPEEVMIENVSASGKYQEHKEEQTITFPLAEGQKLYKGDYLADDGIHHVRKQVVLNGTEDWIKLENNYYLTINDKKTRFELTKEKMLCTHFKEATTSVTGEIKAGEFFEGYYLTGNRNVFFNYDNGAGGIDNWKSYLAQQKTAGTPVVVEYELETEKIEPYTPEQQTAYNKLQNAQSYYNVTNVFTDKALLEFKYIADTQTWVLNKLNNTNQELLNIAGGN